MTLAFVTGAVRVQTPATSANLGPGFDALGLALTLQDVVTARVTSGGVRVTVTGEGDGDDERPAGEEGGAFHGRTFAAAAGAQAWGDVIVRPEPSRRRSPKWCNDRRQMAEREPIPSTTRTSLRFRINDLRAF